MVIIEQDREAELCKSTTDQIKMEQKMNVFRQSFRKVEFPLQAMILLILLPIGSLVLLANFQKG